MGLITNRKQFKKRRGSKIRLGLRIFFALFSLFLLAAIGIFGLLARDLPSPEKFAAIKLAESTKIYDRTGEILLYDIHGEEKRTIIPLSQVSPYVKLATIAAEDKDFYKHRGIDAKAILRATGHNILVWLGIRKGKRVAIEGGSTITQQIIKNTLLSRERTIKRKLKEWILALELEMRYNKDKILEFYLNLVPYGSNSYGIEAGANTYFKKSSSNLTLAEAATLASLPKAPTYFSPYGSRPEELWRRQQYVLQRMRDLGFISDKDLEEAKEEKIEFAPNVIPIRAPHFVFYVKEYLEQNLGAEFVEKSGLKIITSLDWEKQKLAEEIIQEKAGLNKKNSRAFNAGLAAIDPKTGEILAMVGSKDYFGKPEPEGCSPGKNCLFDPNVNMAIRPRQPGSSFKPIVYAKAFERGFSAKTMVFDLETEFNPFCSPDGEEEKDLYGLDCYRPKNYDGKFRGPVSLREALGQSLNVPSVKVLYLAGVKNSIDLAHQMGITTLDDPDRYGLALVLGGGEVKLLDLTSAYGVLANEGIRNPANPILKILDSNGKTLEEYQTKPEAVIDPDISRQINDILSDNKARAPIFGENSSLYIEGRQVAAKTGTTQEYRDAWTIGYTPSIVVGVWVGNNNNAPMQKGPGAMVAAPIWRNFMEEALKNLEPEEFPKPEETSQSLKPMLNGEYEKVYKARLDKTSGKLATDLTPQNLVVEKEYKEIHNILQYVDKNDPLGQEPQNPGNDSQYQNWEKSVKKWMESFGVLGKVYNEKPPEDYDALHTEENRPGVWIEYPEDGAILHGGEPITLKYRASSRLGLKKIEYFFDDVLVEEFYPKEILETPFIFSFSPSGLKADFKEKNHLVTVVAYDMVENKSLDQIEIIIE